MEKNFMLYIVIIVLNVIIIYFKILILLSFEQLVMIFDNLKLVDQRNINGGIYIEIYFNDLTAIFSHRQVCSNVCISDRLLLMISE